MGEITLEINRVPTFTGKPEKNIVHPGKSWNFAKNNKNHGNMEFWQSGNVGSLGYCGNEHF